MTKRVWILDAWNMFFIEGTSLLLLRPTLYASRFTLHTTNVYNTLHVSTAAICFFEIPNTLSRPLSRCALFCLFSGRDFLRCVRLGGILLVIALAASIGGSALMLSALESLLHVTRPSHSPDCLGDWLADMLRHCDWGLHV
jgi:hypothetical protein